MTEEPVSETDHKNRYRQLHGAWDSDWDALLHLDRAYVASFVELSAVPQNKNHLGSKVRELIHVAVNASITHLFTPGIRRHVRRALQRGASVAEITEVLELTSAIGIHAAQVGVPLLIEVLTEQGLRQEDVPLTEHQQNLKKRFVAARGYWHPFWDGLLSLDPEMFEAYTDFSSVPWRSDALDPKVKELVYCAIDASTTHLYPTGLKTHMINALSHGATPGELMEVLEVVSLAGIDTMTVAGPILLEESALATTETREGS